MQDIAQVAIVFFGGLGVALLADKRPRVMRWGFLVALLGEPWWLISALENKQWGIVAMVAWYSVNWIRGIRNGFKPLRKSVTSEL